MINYVVIRENVRSGEEVFTGFPGQFFTAPEEDGFYKFVEYVEDRNGKRTHVGFDFLKQ